MKQFDKSGNRGFSNNRQQSNPRGPSRASYDSPKADPDFDLDFYRKVARNKSRTDFLECRITASRTTDERTLRAFVKAMFVSKAHRREISACIRGYVGHRAIPALLWNLDRLPPLDRMFQARLLCLVGHLEAFGTYCDSVQSFEEPPGSVYASVRAFLTEDAPTLLPGLPSFLTDHDDESFLLWAPYFHKYASGPITERLATIASTAVFEPKTRNTALRLLIGFNPKHAISCLMEHGEGFSLPVLIRRLEQFARSDDGGPHLPELLRNFLTWDDNRRLVALLFLPATDDDARQLQFDWITDQLEQRIQNPVDHDLRRQTNIVGQWLCKHGHPEWIAYLEAVAKDGQLARFAWDLLVNTGHPSGLRLICEEIDGTTRPEDLFHPCVVAVRTYRKDALCVLERVVATGNLKLRARIDEVVATIWPGKSIDDLITKRDSAAQSRPSTRSTRTQSTFDRDRGIVDEVKSLEQHACQTCGRTLVSALTGERYAEAHHLQPLGHGGSDSIDNLLCLCPLCHVLFHLGCIGIDSRLRIHVAAVVPTEPFLERLRLAGSRRISVEAMRYHWDVLFIPSAGARFDNHEHSDC